jgi:hypothetical protein
MTCANTTYNLLNIFKKIIKNKKIITPPHALEIDVFERENPTKLARDPKQDVLKTNAKGAASPAL